MPLLPGDTLFNGQYRILRELGGGGFGLVYQARDTLLDEDVAIKELFPALVGDETMLKRFLSEAKATMRLNHDHIVRTHNVFSEKGHYYIVMECMGGGSLRDKLKARGALPVDEAVRIAADVCEGLSYAHGRGVVHCDLKPANILFTTDGIAKVADFGIAHVSEDLLTRSWHTRTGSAPGTLHYMSPEQLDGIRDDVRVDIYALGTLLYRALTGQTYLDFDQGDTPSATARNVDRIHRQHPRPPSVHNSRIPTWLDTVVLKALAKQPKDRYAGSGELRAALVRQTPEAPPTAVPTPDRETPVLPWHRQLPRWFWPAVAGAAVLLLIASILVVSGGLGGDEEEAPASSTQIVQATATVTRSHTTAPTPSQARATPAESTSTPTPTLAPTASPTPQPTASPTLQPTATVPTEPDLLDEIRRAGTLVVAIDPNYAPQSFLNDLGELEGFDVEVAREVAKRLGIELVFLEIPDWNLVTGGNWGSRWDLSIGSMTVTEDRARVLWFTDPYYYTPDGEPLAFALDKSRGRSDEMLAELNRIIAAMHGDGTLSRLSLEWFGTDLTIP